MVSKVEGALPQTPYEAKQRELDVMLRSLVVKERTLLADIVALLKEIDRRKVFLELGHPSLFDYLVKGIGYSEGAAQRRIDAARLMTDIPDLHERIMRGGIKLNQAAMIQKAAREVQRLHKRVVLVEEKRDLLHVLEGRTHTDSQKIVSSFFKLPALYQTRQNFQADGSVRIEVTLSRGVYDKMMQARESLSHVVPSGDIGQIIEFLVERAVDQSAPRKPKRAGTANVAVTRQMKQKVLKRDRVCQFVDPVSKKRCGGRWALQVDHIHPRFLGGTNDVGNLQLLCAKHNRLKYKKDRLKALNQKSEN